MSEAIVKELQELSDFINQYFHLIMLPIGCDKLANSK